MKNKSQSTLQQKTNLNWDQLHERIAAVESALDETSTASPETLHRAWAQRAAQIARKAAEGDLGEQCQLVVVRLGQELYGLEVQYVFDVRPLERLTPIPRLPHWVLGVVNLRGQILSVVDLAGFLGLPHADKPAESDYLVVIETPEMELALRVDEIFRVESLPANHIHDPAGMALNIRTQYVRGVAELQKSDEISDLMVILDLPALLRDPQLIIHEESL